MTTSSDLDERGSANNRPAVAVWFLFAVVYLFATVLTLPGLLVLVGWPAARSHLALPRQRTAHPQGAHDSVFSYCDCGVRTSPRQSGKRYPSKYCFNACGGHHSLPSMGYGNHGEPQPHASVTGGLLQHHRELAGNVPSVVEKQVAPHEGRLTPRRMSWSVWYAGHASARAAGDGASLGGTAAPSPKGRRRSSATSDRSYASA